MRSRGTSVSADEKRAFLACTAARTFLTHGVAWRIFRNLTNDAVVLEEDVVLVNCFVVPSAKQLVPNRDLMQN